jgi:hypothetical protein
MASIRWTFIIDITVDGQRLLDLISSTHRRRPACCWTYPCQLVVDGQRAAGLIRVDSSSTASVPLGLLTSTRRRRPACRWTSSRRLVVDGQRTAGLSLRDSLVRRLPCADRRLPCADSFKIMLGEVAVPATLRSQTHRA